MPLPSEIDILKTRLEAVQTSLKLIYDNTEHNIGDSYTHKQKMLRELYTTIQAFGNIICRNNKETD